jgi:DNA-binding transcriptional LysR family regulator
VEQAGTEVSAASRTPELPAIVRRMSAEAPRAGLEVLPWESPFRMTPERLRSLDLFTSCSTAALPGFDRRPLFSDRDVLVVRRDHPLVARLGTLRTFAEAHHIAVTRDPFDAWLLNAGVKRRIGLTVPSYLQALHAAAASDLVARATQINVQPPSTTRLTPLTA